MWSRTLIGLIVGLVLSMSLFTNVAYLIPMPRHAYLLLGFVGGILLWAGFMTYFYCASSLKKSFVWCGPLLLVSALVNGLYIGGVVS